MMKIGDRVVARTDSKWRRSAVVENNVHIPEPGKVYTITEVRSLHANGKDYLFLSLDGLGPNMKYDHTAFDLERTKKVFDLTIAPLLNLGHMKLP